MKDVPGEIYIVLLDIPSGGTFFFHKERLSISFSLLHVFDDLLHLGGIDDLLPSGSFIYF